MKTYTNICRLGNSIKVRYDDGSNDTIKFKPTLYVADNNSQQPFTDIHKKISLRPVNFDNMRDASSYIKDNAQGQFKTYGTKDFVTEYIRTNQQNALDTYNPDKIRVFNFDIETIDLTGKFKKFPEPTEAPVPIVSISLFDSKTKKMYLWGCGGDYAPSLNYVEYRGYDTEYDMLLNFIEFWETNSPDVITGWNIDRFDIPYLVNRIEKLYGSDTLKRLSPWRKIRASIETDDWGNTIETYQIYGISSIDLLSAYKKFTFVTRSSYALDAVGEIEVGEKKLEYNGSIQDFFINDWKKAMDYNIKDVELVQKIDDKLNLLKLIYSMAYMTSQNFEDCFSPVRTWENKIYVDFMKLGKVPNVKVSSHKRVSYPGGFVKEAKLGFSRWVCSFDLNSLYPSLIRQFNISPETKLKVLPDLKSLSGMPNEDYVERIDEFMEKKIDNSVAVEYNCSLAASGMLFDNTEQGMLPWQMQELYIQRKKFKGQMIEAEKKLQKLKESNLV